MMAITSNSGTNSILEHCEFEQPEIRDHYFPTFLKNPETEDRSLPLIDLLIGADGAPIQQVHIGELPPGPDGEVLSLVGRYTKFTPAMACGEPVEGFYRFALSGFFFVEAAPEGLTAPPYARFTLPDELFASLRTANYISNESHLTFILEISPEGKVGEIKGTSDWSRHLAKGFMPQFLEPLSFTPARCGDNAVPIEIAMFLSLNRRDLDETFLNTVHFNETRKPMPKRPEGLDYPEPKIFTVGGTITEKGLIREIQIFDPLEQPERISVINALRNWYLPPEDTGKRSPVVMLKLSFTGDSDEALLLEQTYRERLMEPPLPIKQKAPVYPAEARRKGLQGAVEVLFVVGKEGDVLHAISANSSNPIFEESALKAVRKWRFKPGTFNGTPVNTRCRIVIPYKFER